MLLKTITIHQAAQLMTESLSHIPIPTLAEFGFDDDDDRWFYQTMSHTNAIVGAIKAGQIRAVDEFSLMPVAHYKDMPLTQPIRQDDFFGFAKELGVPIDQSTEVKKSTRPTNHQPHQEAEILRAIRELGYDPKSLPKRDTGKRGAKATVREKLNFSESVFNKAWERLRSSGDIIGGE